MTFDPDLELDDHVAPVPPFGPCLACSFGAHPDDEHADCGCPCAWSSATRRGALVVSVRTVAAP